MKPIFTRLLLLFMLLVACHLCFAQKIDSAEIKLINQSKHEKIFIHYDRNNYSPGDTVWFKAYLLEGPTPARSTNFYVELLDDYGNMLARLSAPILESSASGSFLLPADSVVKNVYCRAYTSATAADTSLMYTRQLLYANHTAPAAGVSIRFLPEGGYWVNNVPSLMAFKVSDANGMPVNATGYIKHKEQTVAEFATTHNGMGVFTINPVADGDYTAVWKDAVGHQYTTPLPARHTGGIGMHVSNLKDQKKYFIFRSKDVPVQDKNLVLIAFMHNNMVYKAKIDLSQDDGVNGLISVGKLPSGILHIVVLNGDKKPLAERLTFVNNDNYTIAANIRPQQVSTSKRGLNKIKIDLQDSVRSNFSVSVTDADLDAETGDQDNIVSHLFLTGDLRGKIVNPAYYFTANNDTVARNLDLVMLTHGWRNYNGDNVAAAPAPQIKNSKFISLSGKITDSYSLSKLSNTTVSVIIQAPDSSSVLVPLYINKKGEFYKDGIRVYGNAGLYFKTSNRNITADKLRLMVDNGLIDSTYRMPFTAERIYAEPMMAMATSAGPATRGRYLKGNNLLHEVIIKAKPQSTKQQLEDIYTTGSLFTGGITTNFMVGNDPKAKESFTVFQYLHSKIAGLKISNPLSNNPAASWRDIAVTFYINNIKSSPGEVRELPMSEIEYLKVYDPSMGGAFFAYGGVVAIYTKKGKGFNYQNTKPDAMLKGYTAVREFYSPDYATAVKSPLPDFRPTLYWNPNLILDKNKNAFEFQFYNNDITGKFKLTIEGMNAEGRLVHISKLLQTAM